MRIETMTITPEQAESWLASGSAINQRNLNNRKVLAFARSMTRGQWRVTHQGIALDPDGVLIDGQHRLSAIVAAQVPVPMMIAFDVPRASFDVIDTGTARSSATALHIAGYGDSTATAAAVRAILIHDVIGGTRRIPSTEIRGMFTTRDVLDFMEGPRGDVLRGVIGPSRAAAIALGRVGMRTWMAAAFAILDESEPNVQLRTEFLDRLHSGAMLEPTSPILAFRRWILSDTGYIRSEGAYRGQVGIAGFLKAWNGWIEGKSMHQFYFQAGRENWPTVTEVQAVLSGRDVLQDRESVSA